ncbi:MAG: T9SS C-terminal target domain-containing protein [Haliscomenobacteraceae bacterium CHB4]|nr:T9SS C-terminal target domain-containing protein [Haliscomenobacteraceae bacterium CHB4]
MKSFFCTLLCMLSLNIVRGQGWERLYALDLGLNDRFTLAPMPDGGFLMLEDAGTNPNQTSSLIKLASDGSVQWVQNQQDVLGIIRPAVLPVGNDELLFLGRGSSSPLVKTNANLDILWSKPVNSPYACPSCGLLLKPTPGGYLISWTNVSDYAPTRIIKTDLNGDLIWEKTFNFGDEQNFTGMRYFLDLVSDNQGNIYASGVQDIPYAPMLAKISPDGDLIFLKTYTQPALIYGMGSLTVVNDNRIVGSCSSNIAVLDSNGLVVGTIQQDACNIEAAGDGNLLIGYSAGSNLIIRKITLSGTELWKLTADNLWNMEGIYSLWHLSDGGTAGIGRAFTGSSYEPFVIRTDANGVTFTNYLHGNIFADLDGDCANLPPDDQPASGVVVQAIKNAGTWYTVTDTSGNYGFRLDTGAYLLRVIPPNYLWMPCADSVPFTFSTFNDTIELDEGITSDIDCPWPQVSLGAPFLRRCFPSTYKVTYSNGGNLTADSAVVRLTLDPYLEFQSATIPHTQTGPQVYEFFIGDLPPLAQGSFNVTVLVDCDSTVLGQTHCSTTEIAIANPCPVTQLDQPVISVEAECDGDSVLFTMRNIGGAPMPGLAEFIVIEDLIVMREGSFQLGIQEDTLVKCPSDGSTFRMYAGQAPGAPPFFSPTAAVEGCNGPIQPGFWNMFPEFYPAWADRDCQPNIGAYDPNDKQAVPVGYGPEGYIGLGVPLEYMIRFQNTGTDTAFNIVIRDTLSAWLEPASVRPGAASHPYMWTLLGQNVIEFKFGNILLPDSNTNLTGSNGYVKFYVEQKPDVPLETDIFNRAAIYFDFNAPVLTNTTRHRAGKDFILVSIWSPNDPLISLRAFPNPASEGATVELSDISPDTMLEWALSDATGRMVLRQTTLGGRLDFQRGGLPTGIYWLQVREKGKLLGVGKLIFH